MIERRSFLLGVGALIAAPAVIRKPGLLMPVRTIASASSMTAIDHMMRVLALMSQGNSARAQMIGYHLDQASYQINNRRQSSSDPRPVIEGALLHSVKMQARAVGFAFT